MPCGCHAETDRRAGGQGDRLGGCCTNRVMMVPGAFQGGGGCERRSGLDITGRVSDGRAVARA